jgi:hypothetical protein
MDDDKAAVVADALELLHLNQIALRASVEEVSTWIRQRGERQRTRERHGDTPGIGYKCWSPCVCHRAAATVMAIGYIS